MLLFLFIMLYWHGADYLELRTRRHRKLLQEALAVDDTWRLTEPQSVP